jgi:molybdopterin biosynthesis enzyme
VNCSIATDTTLSGSPASALPSSTKIPLPVLEEVYGTKAMRLPPSKKSVMEAIHKAGNGKRGIIYVIYGDIPPSAHVFNVENKAGKIIFYDGQQEVNTEELFDNIVHMRLLNTN